MSDVAAAAKQPVKKPEASAAPVVSSGAAAPVATRSQALRAVQVRKLTTGRFKPVGHFSEPQQALLPAEFDFADALVPEFWSFIAPSMQANASSGSTQDRVGTVIEVRSEDHAFFGLVYVKGLRRNVHGQADALDVVCIGPIYDSETKASHAIDLKTGGKWQGRQAKAG